MKGTESNAALQIVAMDFEDEEQVRHFMLLMNDYARDEMGLDEELPDRVRATLVDELQKLSDAISFIAYAGDKPAGLVNGFAVFSTFKAGKVLNIHDLFVRRGFRGRRIGDQLLQAAQRAARQLKCRGLTIEVREDNHAARRLYERFGFEDGDPPVRSMTKEFY